MSDGHGGVTMSEILDELEEMVSLAEAAMRTANHCCGQYEIKYELADAKALISKAKATPK